MEYAILGPLEVRDEDQAFEIPGLKERAILGLLIVEAGTVVSADRMIFELWGDEPPETALPTLRTYISRLRKTLGEGNPIVTQKPGYLFRPDNEDLDVARFEALADQAAKARTDPEASSRAARGALELWRGPALADLAGFLFAESEARRLEERRITTLEIGYEADLRLGRQDDIIPDLRTIASLHPYQERFWAQLMLALYRSGRAGEALEAYAEAERALGEALGIGPSPELRSLERSIVMEDPALELPATSPAHNLPAAISSFIGRDKEIAALVETLGRSRLVTLTGVGGSGKTRLALECAIRSLGQYPDGVWQVELAPIRDPEAVASAVSLALGEPASHAADPMESVIEYLGDQRVLLLLDNCEHLLAAIADLVTKLAPRCPNLRLLITSREPLKAPGETVWLVPPLELPDPESMPADQESAEAFRLFISRARDAYPPFTVTDENRPVVTELCRHLSGLPLALELAAARSTAFTPGQLLERLGEGLEVLTAGPVSAERHQTMSSALDWSYRLLDERLATLFSRLAVFRGGWTIEDAQQIVGEDDETAEDIASLVDKSLVETIPGEPGRYRLLEPVREFADDLLRKTGEAEEITARHAARYLALAREADRHLRGPEQVQWLARMRADHDNIRKAIRWALDADRSDIALELVAACAWFWFMAGHWRESWTWLEAALDAGGDSHPELRAKAVYTAGGLQVIRVNPKPVMALLEQGLSTCRRSGETYGEAWCLHLLGHAGFWTSVDEPMQKLVDARALFEQLDKRWELAWSDRYIGDALAEEGKEKESVELQLASISAFREMGDRWSTAFGLHNVANVILLLGEDGPRSSRPYFERCLRISEDIGDPVWAAHAINGLAHCDYALGVGDPESLYKEAQDRLRLIGDDNCLSIAVGYLGDIRRQAGDTGAAAAHYAEALRIKHRIASNPGIATNLDRLARLAVENGHPIEAGRLAGAVERAVRNDEVKLISVYRDLHNEVMASVDFDDRGEELEDVVPLALEVAEAIAAQTR